MKFPKLFRKSYQKTRGRFGKNTFITKSGNAVRIRRSLGQKYKAHRETLATLRADRLSKMPRGRWNRILYRLDPKNLYHYWFSREGGVMALKVGGIGLFVFSVLLIGLFAYYRKDLKNILDPSGNKIGGSIRYYDRTGQTLLWEDFDAVKRTPVEGDKIAQVMKDATVAIEDKDFFKHGGFDTSAIFRAAINNVLNRETTQGGSTITQQLVKLTQNWTQERTVSRKIKELILSVELERSYSKDQILAGYLNTAPYGGIEYGVETASRTYFGKTANELSLDEAAMLASIPKSPSLYSPYSTLFDKAAFIGRQHYILDQMVDQGKITRQQAEGAKKVDTIAKVKPRLPKYEGIKAPYFVLTAREKLIEIYGTQTINLGGWKIITTLDMDKQAIAEDEVQKGLAQVKRQGGDVAAFVAEDVKTGQVVSMVGGPDFTNTEYGQNNYAHAYKVPPGSSFKPYDYVSAMDTTDKFGAGTVLFDTQGPLPGYPCTNKARTGGNCLTNYDHRYPGPETVRYALGGSRNVPAVKAMLIAGVDKTIEVASRLMDTDLRDGLQTRYGCYEDEGLTKPAQCYGSAAIGDGAYLRLDEHVHGFGSLSRNGRNIPQTYILKVVDGNNKTISEWKPISGEQAVREEAAYIISDILNDTRASYFGGKNFHNHKGHKFSIKTGTTNDSKDGLIMGYSTQYASGVWVGYHNRRKAMSGFMETMTRPIMIGWMRRVHDNLQPIERERPKGLQTLPAYVVRSHVGSGSVEPSPDKDIYPSWYQQSRKTAGNEKRIIDVVSNKLATECTPDRAKKEIDQSAAENYSADPYHNNGITSDEKDDIHKCGDALPTIGFSSAPDPCNSGSCTFTASFSQGTHPINSDQFHGTVNFLIDNQVVQSFEVGGPGSVSYNYTGTYSGNHTASVEIIDSVLYSNSDSVTVNFGGDGGDPSITSPSNGQDVDGNTTSVRWTGGSPNYTVEVDAPGGGSSFSDAATCSNVSGNSCTIATVTSGTYRIRVRDSDGDTSSVITFTK